MAQPLQRLNQQIRRTRFRCLHPRAYRKFQQRRRSVTADDYSFKPFDDYRCIFVHVPKCAGVSVCRSLFGNLGGGHTTMERYEIIFSPRELDRYFKFTFVRNPWDRLVSAFFFLKKGGMNDADRDWARKYLTEYETFERFVVEGLSRPEIRDFEHFLPQAAFICTGDDLPRLDYIGYFENLEADFTYICRRLGIRSTLPALNANESRSKDYRQYFNETTRETVAKLYARDIRLFDYSFDNSTVPDALRRRDIELERQG